MVTCAGCRKRIPRKEIREHVEAEMKAMETQHKSTEKASEKD